ncbi:MAG: hypothetical protein ACI9R8_000786 [Candidatus Paceibacteria bacterium]
MLLSSGYKCWSKQVRSHTPAILRALWEVWRQDLLVRERGSAVSGVVLDIHQAEWFGTSINGVVRDIHKSTRFGTSIKDGMVRRMVRDIHQGRDRMVRDIHQGRDGSGHPSTGLSSLWGRLMALLISPHLCISDAAHLCRVNGCPHLFRCRVNGCPHLFRS